MLERLGMLFVVCGAFGMTDLAGVRRASGFFMLARILCHIHVSDVVHPLQLMMHAFLVCCMCGMILLYALMCTERVLFAPLPAAAFHPCAMCLTPSTRLA